MFYKELSKKLINRLKFIKKLQKYKLFLFLIIFRKFIVWPFLKPKKFKVYKKELFLSLKNYPDPSRELYSYRNFYSLFEKKILQNNIRLGYNCIDIGSNIGFFTLLFLYFNKNTGNIYSFESDYEVYKILKKNFNNEKRVKPIFGFVDKNKLKDNSIVVDDIIDEEIHFIKIDIDGLDLNALKSCEKIIRKYKPKLIVELSEASFAEHNIHYSETIKYLKNENYKIYELGENIIPFNRKLKYKEVINIFATYKK